MTDKQIQQFITKRLNSLKIPKEELQRRYVEFPFWFDMEKPYARLKRLAPYALIKEGLIHSWNGFKVLYSFMSGVRDDDAFIAEQLHERLLMYKDANWASYLKHAHLHAAEDTARQFRLARWQISILETQRDSGVYEIIIVVPDIAKNIDIMKDVMACYGYFLTQSQPFREDNSFVALRFMPKFQPLIDEEVRKYKYLYHVSPKRFEAKILKNGLVPKSKNELYDYPGRIHFIVNMDMNDGTELPELDPSKLNMLANSLVSERKHLVNQYVDDTKYVAWRIRTKDLPDNVHFCYDFTDRINVSVYT